MNPIPRTDGAGGRGAEPLRARRCARHAAREAAVRCPQCGGFFCRECVVEHAERFVCATCLVALTATSQRKQKPARRGRVLREALGLGLAVVIATLCFHALGTLLLRVPTAVHEGTLWRQLTEGGAP